MKGIVARNGRAQLASNLPIPTPAKGQVVIKVQSTAMNRADTLQRAGKYPPPPGCTEVLGLEIAGNIHDKHPSCHWEIGTPVMALVSGGAFAEYCLADEGSVMPIPKGITMKQASCIPETFLTAFQLLHLVGQIRKEDCLLVHAAASGVGTAAIQLAKFYGCKSIIATTSANKLKICKDLGATDAFDRRGQWDEEILKAGKSVDLVLDCIGATYADQNIKVLGNDSRWVLYGLMGGFKSPESLFPQILRKRISLMGTTLRARSDEYKAHLVNEFDKSGVLEAFSAGTIKVILDERSFKGLENVDAALDYMEANTSIGKIALELAENGGSNHL
jgi:tumor protein p53-inducible protein 3